MGDGCEPIAAPAVRSSFLFCCRTVLKLIRVPEQLFDVTMYPVMFTLMFTYLFGGALADSTGDYLHYLLPGILVQSVLFTTVNTGFSIRSDVTTGYFDRIRSLPVWKASPIVGALLGDIVRYLFAAAVTVAIGLILGYRPGGGVTGMVLGVIVVVGFATCLSWIWISAGLVLRTPASVTSIGMTILIPLTFASSIFVHPHTMPEWLGTFVGINPITHVAGAVRALAGGTAAGSHLVWTAVSAAVVLCLFVPVSIRRYGRMR